MRGLTGVGILVVGVCVAIWSIAQVGQLIWSNVSPGLVTAITPDADHLFTIGLPEGEGDITFSSEIFTTIGYVFVVVLLMLAVSLATVLIKGGVALLQPGVKKEKQKT